MDPEKSIFYRVLLRHEAMQAAEATVVRERAEALSNTRAAFVASFREAAITVARPIFDEFAADARERGFAARVEESLDDLVRPAITLHVNPSAPKGAAGPSENCSFELAALVSISEVEHISHFDLRANERGHRINPDGTKRGAFGVASLHREAVEREVEEFWKLCLSSRSNKIESRPGFAKTR